MPKQMIISYFDFFNQEMTCEILVQTLYDLNHLEFKLYCTLLQIGLGDVSELMKITGQKDRTMVNRSLSSLHKKKLCKRRKISHPGQRGYYYVYKPTQLSVLKERLLKKLAKWYEHVNNQIACIEARFVEYKLNG